MHRRENILVLTSTFPRWRDDTDPPFVYELCKGMVRRFDMEVLAPHAPGTLRCETIDGIRIQRFRYFCTGMQRLAYDGGILSNLRKRHWLYLLVPFFMTGQFLALARALRRNRYCLIHAHWLIPQGLMAVIARRATGKSVPVLCTCHGGDIYALRGKIFRRIKRYALRHVDHVTAVSEAMRDSIGELGGEEMRDRTDVIPMGVDLLGRFVPSKREKEGKTVLFVGRLVEKKGVIYLIRAFASVVKAHPDARLIIVGSGPDEVILKREVKRLALEGQVEFRGAVENRELPSLYQSSPIVAFPSVVAEDGDREGFGLVQVEAMGCECAVVSTDLPAIRDIISHGETGVIVPEKDSEALAEAIIGLFDDPERRNAIGKRGRAFVRKRYDWAMTTKRYERVIEDLLKQGGLSQRQ